MHRHLPAVSTLVLSEIFRAHQGEGPSAGRPATFVRLMGCNLTCSWCDTPYTWDATRFDLRKEGVRTDVRDVAQMCLDPLLVITGGEPLLQAHGIGALLGLVPGRLVEIETNGTLPPPAWASRARWNVSPKLTHSGQATTPHPGWSVRPDVAWKFVVTCAGDLVEVAAYHTPPRQTWIMPEGTDADRMLATAREINDTCLLRGWSLTLRQHVLLWGDERRR